MIFLGKKHEPLPPLPPSPLSLKFVSGTPGQAVKSRNDVNVCNVQAVFCNCISCVFTQIMMSRIPTNKHFAWANVGS